MSRRRLFGRSSANGTSEVIERSLGPGERSLARAPLFPSEWNDPSVSALWACGFMLAALTPVRLARAMVRAFSIPKQVSRIAAPGGHVLVPGGLP